MGWPEEIDRKKPKALSKKWRNLEAPAPPPPKKPTRQEKIINFCPEKNEANWRCCENTCLFLSVWEFWHLKSKLTHRQDQSRSWDSVVRPHGTASLLLWGHRPWSRTTEPQDRNWSCRCVTFEPGCLDLRCQKSHTLRILDQSWPIWPLTQNRVTFDLDTCDLDLKPCDEILTLETFGLLAASNTL